MPKHDLPTLADRAAKVAEDTPRDAIKALLTRFLPIVPVTTRPAKAPPPIGSAESGFGEDGELKVPRQPARFGSGLRSGKRSVRKAVQFYELTGKRDTSRAGTFRRYMLTDIILAHKDTRSARMAHALSGQYADQTINFSWAEKEGYIRFI